MVGYDHSLRKSVSAPEIHKEEEHGPITWVSGHEGDLGRC